MRGQVLVIFAFLLVILLGFTGVAIDIGRQNAEQRHIQTAADAAALAACRALIDGASDNAAAAEARTVADINIERSPSGTSGVIAPDIAKGLRGRARRRPGLPAQRRDRERHPVRVAISSTVDTTLARVVGIPTLDASARARCTLQGGPALPIVARRYDSAPGPGGGFTDYLASIATSTTGAVDTVNPWGYGGRTPASEAAPGPAFELYGPGAKAANESSFRGFVALDVRNFESTTSRVYYNGVTSGTNEQTLKNKEGAYLLTRLSRDRCSRPSPTRRTRTTRSPHCSATTRTWSSTTSTTCTSSAIGSCWRSTAARSCRSPTSPSRRRRRSRWHPPADR